MIHHARMTLKAWFPLCTAWHIQSHSCHLITTGHWLTQTQQGGGKRLPAGQGPWSSCLSHCQVSKTNSGQKHDTLGCESACEWQSLPLMEGKKCKSSLVTSKTCWTRFRTGLRSKRRRAAKKPQAASFCFFPVCHKHLNLSISSRRKALYYKLKCTRSWYYLGQ